MGPTDTEAIKTLASLSPGRSRQMCDYEAGASPSFQSLQDSTEDAAFLNFLREEMNNIKENEDDDEDEDDEEQEQEQVEEEEEHYMQQMPLVTLKEESRSLPEDHFEEPSQYLPVEEHQGEKDDVIPVTSSGTKRKRAATTTAAAGIAVASTTAITDEVSVEMQRRYYRRQLEIVEDEHVMRVRKIKREEELIEEQHRAQMAILEKQQELANTQLEFWAQKKLLDS